MTHRLPADGRGILCGHNFQPIECPYSDCGFREALEKLREADARERILQEQNDTFDQLGAEMAEKLREEESAGDEARKLQERTDYMLNSALNEAKRLQERRRALEVELDAAKVLLFLGEGESLSDGIDRLVGENDRFRELLRKIDKATDQMRNGALREAKLRALELAVRPFLEVEKLINPGASDDWLLIWQAKGTEQAKITIGHLRRLAEVAE